MRDRSTPIIAASIVMAAMMATTWFNAPPVPALVGALGAGGILLWRKRRR